MDTRFYKWASVLFVVVLLLPSFQRWTRLLPEYGLGGVEEQMPKPQWTATNWFNGTFQRQFEERLIRRIGFRGLLVRIDNQINYSLFNFPASGRGTRVIIGKDRWLFEQTYLDRYNSSKIAAEEDNRDRMQKLVRLQNVLRQRGKGFLVVLTPSKVELYSEYLPPDKVVPGRHLRASDYDKMAPLLDEYRIPWLDVPRFFRELKKQSDTPLFPKGGVHWNYYGAALVTTQIIDTLERQMGRNFAQMVCEGTRVDNQAFGTDNDLGDLLNILTWRWDQGPQVHPILKPIADATALKPRLLFVGDSFIFTLTHLMQTNHLFSEATTFYYYKRRFDYPAGTTAPIDHDRLDLAAEIDRVDAVILEINEYWLPKIGFGFVEPALEALEKKAVPASAPENSQ
jgi:alginate O-acetyltransferase complex protein AlgJ